MSSASDWSLFVTSSTAMIDLRHNVNTLTRDLRVYLENQVKINLPGSGVGLSLVLGFGAAYICYYLNSIAKKPQLITGAETLSQFLQRYCPVVTETYYPTFWCWEARVQTLLRPFITAKPWVKYKNELIKTPDGGHISLDWNDSDENALYPISATRPIILILPGLTGTSKESYILHMVKQSEILGYRSVTFNNRGVSGEELLTPRTYCAANTEDLETVISHVQKTFPQAPLMAAGVSMGGHRPILEKSFDIDYVLKAKTIREFDERFTSVMFGYQTIADYYRDASPYLKLKSIEIPVLCLNALDDVFSPSHAIPMQSAKQNPNVALLLTAHGGHIGFLEGIFPRWATYMDRVFKQFTQAVFEHRDELKNT
ncbi:phospholipase ABHD3 isoform X6 [Chiloscyllium plagiosum]|uniref:phospholipase ABHD3 isoform X6 n=1 Tax=Chiloscyllium plagiosum TaxID=36176 RepID=UPI001CB80E83|nr:phospholipase ABHD3 isoform X6 [Chiloscyllium plagiosum]